MFRRMIQFRRPKEQRRRRGRVLAPPQPITPEMSTFDARIRAFRDQSKILGGKR